MNNITIFLIFLVTFFGHPSLCQTTGKDSISVSKVVHDFFDWYINSNRNEDRKENRPIIEVSQDEKIQLEMEKYLNNLRKYNFSEDLISKEKSSYDLCKASLEELTKEQYLNFDDISDYEDIGCGFDNNYRWIGGQELIDGVRINKLSFIGNKRCQIELEYFSLNGEIKSYWNNKTIIDLLKSNKLWKITEVKI